MTRSHKRAARLSRATAALAALLTGAALANPAPASAKPANATVKAVVWAYAPTSAEYRISGGYTAVTGGRDVVIRRTGVGAYKVILEDAASTVSGVAHVVAYGSAPVFCTVAASYPWYKTTTISEPTSGHHVVEVRCFDSSGAPVDSRFVATYTNTRSVSQDRFVYLTTDQAVPAGVRTIPSAVGYDSTGAAITYRRISTGRYDVSFGPDAGGPYAPAMWNVTAFGSNAVHCQPDFSGEGNIRCSNAAGNPVDSRFALTFSKRYDPVGNATGPRFSTSDVRAWDGRLTVRSHNSAVESPPLELDTVDGQVLGTGRYQFTIQALATSYGTAFAGAVTYSSSRRGYCVLTGWYPSGSDEVVRVDCFKYGGASADLDLNLSFTTWPAV